MTKKKGKPLTREDVLKAIEDNGGKARGLHFSGKHFEAGIDLRGVNLEGIIFKGVHLLRAKLQKADLSYANLQGAHLSHAHLEEAYLADAHLEKAELAGAHLEEAYLAGAHLEEAYLADAHLEEAKLVGAHLEEAYLADAHLEEATLWDAHLEEAKLAGAHLEKAKLTGAHLEKAELAGAHLEKAYLTCAHLEKAELADAHLEEAYLAGAHLEGANLSDAHLEEAYLKASVFSLDTKLEDVDWGNYKLGEENKKDFHSAENTYRRLKQWYTNAGISDTAAKFYYREKEAGRKSLKLCSKKNWNNRLAAEFMRAFFGYGEEWKRILIWMAAVIFGLAGAYHLFGGLNYAYSLYFSAVSFTALGYGSWVSPPPEVWVQRIGAAESFVGVFMIALLLVTFVRKWTR